MPLPQEVIQQLVVETVASQDNEALGVVVIVLGKDSMSIGGVGTAPSPDDVSQAMASYAHRELPSTLLH